MPSAYEENFDKRRVDLHMWRKLFYYSRNSRRSLVRAGVFMALSAVGDVTMPLIMAHLIDSNIIKGTMSGAAPWMWLYLGIVLFQVLNTFGFIYNACNAENNVTCDLRQKAFDKLQELSFSYYDKTPVGYIMARLTSDAARLGDTLAWSIVDLFWSCAFMLIAGTVMLIYNWRLGLLILATLPFIAAASIYIRKFILGAYRRVRAANSRITGAFNEGIGGAKTTKTLVLEDKNFGHFKELTSDMYGQSVRAAITSSLLMPIVLTIGAAGTAMILWKGGVQVIAGGISLGEFSFFMWLGSMFFEPINNLARIFAELQSSQAAVERVITLMNTEPEITDTREVTGRYGGIFDPKSENWEKIRGSVTFEDVTFRYQSGQTVLEHFNLRVNPGEHIALVGQTGSGKSTIVNLLCRFYEPTSGRILIEGRDYRERSQQWLHSNLGYVLQTPHLFSGTIRENIRYGRLDATDAEVEAVAKLIRADAFISRLEKGYDTEVGECGDRLSTGEKQLVSFARAILADPALFVLDEATSSIDTEAEQAIQYAMEKTLSGRTSFIIAHRLSTVRGADRILVIEDGRIVEQGTHAELMGLRGHYYGLYTNQFREEENNRLLGLGNTAEEPA